MLYTALICISVFQISTSLKLIPGQPLPHADILEDILSRHLSNTSYSDNSVSDIIQGTSDTANETRDLNYKDDNLDVKVLDHTALKKVINLVETRLARQVDFRKRYHEAHKQTPYVKEKCLDMMKQSIYFTIRRMNDTRPFRNKYRNHHSFQIAVLYGAAAAIISKMEHLFAQMKHFYWRTHFLWYLILYEKMLSCNTDINNLVERIFLIHHQFAIIRGPKEEMEAEDDIKDEQRNQQAKQPMPDDMTPPPGGGGNAPANL